VVLEIFDFGRCEPITHRTNRPSGGSDLLATATCGRQLAPESPEPKGRKAGAGPIVNAMPCLRVQPPLFNPRSKLIWSSS
jgi:hypothetical protein